MPIYAYRCADCGHTKDVLQKLSDAPLTACPECGGAFAKQLTAAGFQLKGSGWYVTDFKGNGSNGNGKATSKPADGGGSGGEGGSGGGTSDGGAKPAAATEASSPAGGCGTSCACH